MRIAVLALLLAPATAFADVVVLEDGQRFEGVVTERGDTVQVRMAFGTVGFERAAVKGFTWFQINPAKETSRVKWSASSSITQCSIASSSAP